METTKTKPQKELLEIVIREDLHSERIAESIQKLVSDLNAELEYFEKKNPTIRRTNKILDGCVNSQQIRKAKFVQLSMRKLSVR